MPKTEWIYRLTESGLKAYDSETSGLPSHLRSILALIETDTHSDVVRTHLRRRYAEKQIFAGLDALVTMGFLESEPASAKHDLDFTGNFSVDEFLGQRKAA